MTSRALARAGLQPVPHIDLPSEPYPQRLDDGNGGFEYGVDALDEVAESGVNGSRIEEALLNLADSLVLPFSLLQTRQHHLSQLLPHIFSHPPIPSHSKPRPKPIPPGTFIFPTPQPELPLPLKEYHAPSKPGPSTPGPSTPASAISTEPNPPAEAGDSKGKGKEKARPKPRDKNDAPAHEIECIARITLSIGPISYPGTELWVGRFLEPRQDGAKYARKRPIGGPKKEKVEKERKRPINPLLPARVGQNPVFRVDPTVGVRPPANSPLTARPPAVRPPIPGQPPRQPGGPLPRPPAGTSPARPPIEPSLIQRVNQAATQHPWLSVIIHKAARNNATKDELAKLGRIVARLGRGEGIGEGPTDGLSFPARPPVPVTGASSSTVRPPAPIGSSNLPPDESGGSDGEVDMSGKPQVGGGPIDPRLLPQSGTALNEGVPDGPRSNAEGSTLSSAPSSPMSSVPDIVPAQTALKQAPPTPAPLLPPPMTIPLPRPPVPRPPPQHPPRRVYPLPPPFLLVAFKETPTEKYLLPLGSQSYISRVGDPNPSIGFRSYPNLPSTQAASTTESADLPPVTDNAGPMDSIKPTKGKTRGSMSRSTITLDNVVHTNTHQPNDSDKDPGDTFPAPPAPRVHLPTLPGMRPSRGTVLLSTIVPISEWKKPDWESYEKRMPFYSADYDEKPILPNRPAEPVAPVPTPASPKSPKRESRSPVLHRNGQPLPDDTPDLDAKRLLNLGAESFMPEHGEVQAATIRLEGIDDPTWHRIRNIVEHVECIEMRALGTTLPHLLDTVPPLAPSPIPQIPKPFDPALHPRLRVAYRQFRKARFDRLLQRVPPRSFPNYRLPAPRADLKDAMTDRWTPRPYPISTRPLYLTSPPPDGIEEEVEVDFMPKQKRKRGQAEEEQVMFEMPVSLEMLDERVELGAKKSVTRRVGKLKMDRKPPTGKKHGKRYVVGMVCEGCARDDQKVWRRGPGGKGTLCNECGDKFTTGTLGELKAPGAAKKNDELVEDVTEGDVGEDAEHEGAIAATNKGETDTAVSAPVQADVSSVTRAQIEGAKEPGAQETRNAEASQQGDKTAEVPLTSMETEPPLQNGNSATKSDSASQAVIDTSTSDQQIPPPDEEGGDVTMG